MPGSNRFTPRRWWMIRRWSGSSTHLPPPAGRCTESSDMPTASIVTRSLTKTYGELTALDSFDLEVEQGSIFGLLGPNGAGKTTLIRILTTLMRQSSGEASIEGLDTRSEGRAIRCMIGVVSQENSLDRYLTARENLELHARLHGMEKRLYMRRIDELLELMGLSGRQKDF